MDILKNRCRISGAIWSYCRISNNMPFDSKSWKLPKAEGLYNPALEKDACGVGFIVNIEGKSSRKVSYYFGCKTNFREIDFFSLYI